MFRGVVVGTTLTMQPPLGVTGVQAANDKIKWENIAGVTTPVIAATTVGAVVPNAVQTMPTRRAPSCGNPIFLIRIGPGFRIRPSTRGSRPVSCGDREST